MEHFDKVEALTHLTKVGRISKGWVISDGEINLVDGESVSEQELEAALEASSRVKVWSSPADFIGSLSMGEQAGISLSDSPVLAALRMQLTVWAGEINGDDDRILTGLAEMVSRGIISEERRKELLTA